MDEQEDSSEIPNSIYVAMTRASEKLILFHHYQNDFFEFIDQDLLKSNKHNFYHESSKVIVTIKNQVQSVDVTKLIYHEILKDKFNEFNEKYTNLSKEIATVQSQYFKNVNDTNMAILISYCIEIFVEIRSLNRLPDILLESIKSYKDLENSKMESSENSQLDISLFSQYDKDIDKIDHNKIDKDTDTFTLLKLTNFIFHLGVNKLLNYKLVTDEVLKKLTTPIDKSITKFLEVKNKYIDSQIDDDLVEDREVFFQKKYEHEFIVGILDCIEFIKYKNGDILINIFEYKFVSNLEVEHEIQIYLYYYLVLKSLQIKKNQKNYKIMNYLYNFNDIKDNIKFKIIKVPKEFIEFIDDFIFKYYNNGISLTQKTEPKKNKELNSSQEEISSILEDLQKDELYTILNDFQNYDIYSSQEEIKLNSSMDSEIGIKPKSNNEKIKLINEKINLVESKLKNIKENI
jgi:hypothetical protein